MKKHDTDGNISYNDLRKRNNLAVRKSRERLRLHQDSIIDRFHKLKHENLLLKHQIHKDANKLYEMYKHLKQCNKTIPHELVVLLGAIKPNESLGKLLHMSIAMLAEQMGEEDYMDQDQSNNA